MFKCCKTYNIKNINTFRRPTKEFPMNGWIFPCMGLSTTICSLPTERTIYIKQYEINMCHSCQTIKKTIRNETGRIYKRCINIEDNYNLRQTNSSTSFII